MQHTRVDLSRLRLLCLPWAGGVAGSYAAWVDGLHPVDVVPLELAGRGRRHAEAPLRYWTDPLAIVGRPRRDFEEPFVLFGHSMGAVLAYELACQLEHECGASPAGLILSGAAAPHRRWETLSSKMSDRELAASLVEAGGTPREILDDSEFLAQYLSVLKADLSMLESYRWRPGQGIGCPVYAIAGRADPHATPDAVREWSVYARGSFEFREYPGGHFYFMSELRTFLADVKRFLVECASRRHEREAADEAAPLLPRALQVRPGVA